MSHQKFFFSSSHTLGSLSLFLFFPSLQHHSSFLFSFFVSSQLLLIFFFFISSHRFFFLSFFTPIFFILFSWWVVIVFFGHFWLWFFGLDYFSFFWVFFGFVMFVLLTRFMTWNQRFKYPHQTLKSKIFWLHFMRSKLFFCFCFCFFTLHSSFIFRL